MQLVGNNSLINREADFCAWQEIDFPHSESYLITPEIFELISQFDYSIRKKNNSLEVYKDKCVINIKAEEVEWEELKKVKTQKVKITPDVILFLKKNALSSEMRDLYVAKGEYSACMGDAAIIGKIKDKNINVLIPNQFADKIKKIALEEASFETDKFFVRSIPCQHRKLDKDFGEDTKRSIYFDKGIIPKEAISCDRYSLMNIKISKGKMQVSSPLISNTIKDKRYKKDLSFSITIPVSLCSILEKINNYFIYENVLYYEDEFRVIIPYAKG